MSDSRKDGPNRGAHAAWRFDMSRRDLGSRRLTTSAGRDRFGKRLTHRHERRVARRATAEALAFYDLERVS